MDSYTLVASSWVHNSVVMDSGYLAISDIVDNVHVVTDFLYWKKIEIWIAR